MPAATKRKVTEVILETPSQGGGLHDLIGSGSVLLQEGRVCLSIRPRGLAGLVGFSEKREFELDTISGWDVTGARVEFTSGSVGMISTNGASAPVHICGFRCESKEAASQLTDDAIDGGLDHAKISRHASSD